MILTKIFKNAFLIMLASLVLSACATKKVTESNAGRCLYRQRYS